MLYKKSQPTLITNQEGDSGINGIVRRPMVGKIIPIKHILYQCSPQAASIIGNTWPRQTQTPKFIALNARLIN